MPAIEPAQVDDVVVGCAFPEAEQGLNMARIGALARRAAGHALPASPINRYCSSGLNAVQIAADRIRVGEADVVIAGGAESMSMVPMMGNKVALNPEIFAKDENYAIAYGMGITAEKVAQQWKVAREDQDAFALESHRRAVAATASGAFAAEISPIEVTYRTPDLESGEVRLFEEDPASGRGAASRHLARGARQAEDRLRCQRQRHGRQQLADLGRRGRGRPGLGGHSQAITS